MNLFDAAMLAPNISELIDNTSDGNYNQLDGLQGGVPFSEVVVSGKNLLKYPYVLSTRTIFGVTYTDNGDGTITASGTHDGGTTRSYYGFSPWWVSDYGRLFVQKGKTVTYKVYGLPDTYNAAIWVQPDNNSGDVFKSIRGELDEPIIYTAEQDCYISCGIYGNELSVGATVDFTFYPQLELGDTVTEYAPSITTQELTLTTCGKNFISNQYVDRDNNGIVSTIDDDGIVTVTTSNPLTVNGDAIFPNGNTAIPINILDHNCTIGITWLSGLINGSDTTTDSLDIRVGFLDANKQKIGSSIYFSVSNGRKGLNHIKTISKDSISIPSGAEYFVITCWLTMDTYMSDCRYALQLELGDTATEYEPYNGADYTITPDSNPYIVPTDIYQQDGINNIYVSGEGEPTLSVTGVKENAAVKKIWDKLNELTTAIIVSNGEI